jgi:hypothetical protein
MYLYLKELDSIFDDPKTISSLFKRAFNNKYIFSYEVALAYFKSFWDERNGILALNRHKKMKSKAH